jgi:hypothetical protein
MMRQQTNTVPSPAMPDWLLATDYRLMAMADRLFAIGYSLLAAFSRSLLPIP